MLGHAVLHHLPDLRRAFAEFRRVLRPGGMVVFAGEPSRHGDRLAAVPKRSAQAVAPLWRALLGARAAQTNGDRERGGDEDGHQLERFVDVHAFAPGDLAELARGAGFEDVRVRGEELAGQLVRLDQPRRSRRPPSPRTCPGPGASTPTAATSLLQQVDGSCSSRDCRPAIFYNLMLAARKPA